MTASPSVRQMAAIVLAMADGYVRPASATHARRCNTSVGHLANTCKQCVRAGWMRPWSDGRYRLTEAGEALVPSTPTPRKSDDGEWWLF